MPPRLTDLVLLAGGAGIAYAVMEWRRRSGHWPWETAAAIAPAGASTLPAPAPAGIAVGEYHPDDGPDAEPCCADCAHHNKPGKCGGGGTVGTRYLPGLGHYDASGIWSPATPAPPTKKRVQVVWTGRR